MATTQFPNPVISYRGYNLSMKLYEEWEDKTIYTITGPVTDGIQHNITIAADREVQMTDLRVYADQSLDTRGKRLQMHALRKWETRP